MYNYDISSITDLTIIIVEAPGFHEVVNRSKVTNGSMGESVLNVARDVYDSDFKLDSVESAMGISSFIDYKTESSTILSLPNGTYETRYTVAIEFKMRYPGTSNGHMLTRIIGYTDLPSGLVKGQRFIADDNMEIYVNSVLTIGVTTFQTPHGFETKRRIISDVQYLNPGEEGRNKNILLTRPEDVANKLRTQMEFQLADGYNSLSGLGGIDTIDHTSTLFQSQTISRADNGRLEYVRNMFKAHNEVSTSKTESPVDNDSDDYNDGIQLGSDWNKIYNKLSRSGNDNVTANPLITSLYTRAANFLTLGYFTWRDLHDILGVNTNDIDVTFIKSNPEESAFSEHSNYWNGKTNADLTAYAIANEIPAIMTRYGITRLGGRISNDTTTGQLTVALSSMHLIDGSQVHNSYVDLIETKIMQEVAGPVSKFNNLHTDIEFDLNLYGLYKMNINMGEGVVSFCAPGFADRIFTSQITDDSSDITDLANDISGVFDYGHSSTGDQLNTNNQFNQPVNTDGFINGESLL